MEKFYFEKPSFKWKNQIIEYIDEIVRYNSEINGIETLTKILDGYTFDESLEYCLNLENMDFVKPLVKPLIKTFLLVRENDNKIVGSLNIRYNYPNGMSEFTSNIGYGIRPTERQKGYNKINLYLGLIESKNIGLDIVKLVCDANNLGSVKTIESLNGKLEITKIDPDDNVLTSVYFVNVSETLDKYKDKYCDFIVK